MNNTDVTYDKHDRMNYHPDFHENHKKPWLVSDEKFLIDNYELLGPEQISFELGRTIHVVMTRAYQLRKSGQMKKRTSRKTFKRTYSSK